MIPLAYIGYAAGALVAASVLPQVVRSWRTRSTHDVALSWSVINALGQALFAWYGLAIHSTPLAATSGFTLLLNLVMIGLKLRYG